MIMSFGFCIPWYLSILETEYTLNIYILIYPLNSCPKPPKVIMGLWRDFLIKKKTQKQIKPPVL